MKNCPNCKEEVEDNFQLCWNCYYSFTEEKVVEIKDSGNFGGKELNCLRCGTTMLFTGNYKFHEGFPSGIFGAIGEVFVNREIFDLYLCPKCGKVEFFSPTSRQNGNPNYLSKLIPI
jgi:Zn finger protein HypA/HybF involved in hydrogenase expression